MKWIIQSLLFLVFSTGFSASFSSNLSNWPAQILSNTTPQKNLSSQIPSLLTINFKTIQNLRNAGKLSEAKSDALTYLKSYPNDVDVLLLLGLIYLQENNEVAAEQCLHEVLQKVPTYMDARVALVRIKMMQNHYAEASRLIAIGLKQQPQQQELQHYQIAIAKKEFVILAPEQIAVARPKVNGDVILQDIRNLRAVGKIDLAINKAQTYLNTQDDVDIRLLLGLMQFQQKKYEESEKNLYLVLTAVPAYVDARASLVKIKFIAKDYAKAQQLLAEGLKLSPGNTVLEQLAKDLVYLTKPTPLREKTPETVRLAPIDPIISQANQLLKAQQYHQAQVLLQNILSLRPANIDYRILLAEAYLKQFNDLQALLTIRQGLRLFPNSAPLWLKKGEINFILREYAESAFAYQQALVNDKNNKAAAGGLNDVKSISPRYTYGRNELGIATDNTYVNDLHSIWDYTYFYYGRDTDFGRVAAKVNYASRLHQSAQQYELDLSPRLNRDIYFDFYTAYSDKPALFPNFTASGEGFVNIYNIVEVSAGSKFAKIASTYFTAYTGSLNAYPFNFWLNFRPYYFVPKDIHSRSTLYTFRIRRYFSTDDHYIGFGAGAGRSPDLADLLTVNFLVIKNNFLNANYTFPLINHHLIVDLGVGYQRWQYPSDLVRRLYDGSIGFRYRF